MSIIIYFVLALINIGIFYALFTTVYYPWEDEVQWAIGFGLIFPIIWIVLIVLFILFIPIRIVDFIQDIKR